MSSELIVLDGFTLPDYVLGTQKANDFGKVGGLPKITMFKAPLKFIDQQGNEQHVPGQFKIIKGAEEQTIQAPIPVVIMGITPTGTALNRAYYAGDYVPGTTAAPDCASSNGIAPDSGDLPQAASCALCPHAQWGSKGKGQACSQGKTVYVVGASDVEGDVYQVRVPPTSLKHLSLYGSRLNSIGADCSKLITNLNIFETDDVDYPILSLSVGGYFSPEVSMITSARSESVEIRSMIVIQGAPVAAALPPAQPAAALPVQQPAAQPIAQQPAQQPDPAPAAFQQPVAVAQPTLLQPAAVPQPAANGLPPAQPLAQPQAQPAAQPAPADPSGLGPDSAGVYWSEDFHSSGKSKLLDGTWKKRKGGPKKGAVAKQAAAQTAAQPAAAGAPLDKVLGLWAPQ